MFFFFFFQAEDGIRDLTVTGVQTCALPILALLKNRNWKSRPPHELSSLAAKIYTRSEEHTSELQSQSNLVCRLLLEKKKKILLDHAYIHITHETTEQHNLLVL